MNGRSTSVGSRAAWGLAAIGAAASFLACEGSAQTLAVTNGARVAFLGDSITQGGYQNPGGYVRLVVLGLAANGVNVTPIPAGVSGHKSNDMLARLGRDVLEKKPDWMTLSCGVNDVWHGARGVPLETYKTNITSIVSQAQAAGVKVMILTATMIGEDQPNPNNQKLIAYNDFLRGLARERGCLLADLNADMQAAVAAANAAAPGRGNVLTGDGVHMNAAGNEMMAAGVLRAFGLGEAQLAKAREGWLDAPGLREVAVKLPLSARQYKQLEQVAARQGTNVTALVRAQLEKDVAEMLKAPAQP